MQLEQLSNEVFGSPAMGIGRDLVARFRFAEHLAGRKQQALTNWGREWLRGAIDEALGGDEQRAQAMDQSRPQGRVAFFGEEFDGACGYGKKFDKALRRLAKLASIITNSGRRVVYTVPPNESGVLKRELRLGDLPHGSCDKVGIARYGFLLPMDEAEAKVALDLSGRPLFRFEGRFGRDRVGELPTELVPHFFHSLADSLGAALHIAVTGDNTHHMVEACFKGVGRSLRQAFRVEGRELPSSKGVL